MAQHFDSRSRFLSIATMSLRASVKLVQIRAASRGPKDGMQRSEIRLLPRSIYLMSGPARANCHLKDDPNIQASRNHKDCPCCWTHGIDTDQTEAQGRIGVTFRQLAPWALHEAELKRLADERAERDKAAEEGALQPRRRSTPAPKRDAPTGPATWLSTEGAEAVRSWRSTLAPDAWDALAAADGLTLNNVPARGWHREVKGAGAPLPPAPTQHVASTTSAWVAVCTDLLELAGKEKGGIEGLRGELESRGFRCGEPKWEGKKDFDVSMPQEFPCYYDIVGNSYSGGRQDLISSKTGLVAYLEGCIALAQAGSAYRTTADRDADGDEAARRAGKRATKAVVCFHHPGQLKASDALRSRSAVERYLDADATPLFEAPALDAFSFETDVAGDFPSPPSGYYSRLSAKVVAKLRPAAPALRAAPAVESDGEDDPVWAVEGPSKKPHAPKSGARWLATDGADAVRAWLTTLTPDAWDALAADDGLTRNNVPARGWHREVRGAAPAAAPPTPALKQHVASTASAWVAACTDLLALAAAASQQKGGFTGLRGALMSRGFHCGQISVTRSYYTISVPLEFPCYYDIVGKDHVAHPDNVRSMPQLIKYLQGALALVQTGGTYRLEAERKSDGGEAARRAAVAKVTVVFHYPGQLGPTQVLRSRSDVSRYLATNATPCFEAPPLDAFVFENSVEGAFPRPPPGYYSRLSAKVVEQLRLAAAPALPPPLPQNEDAPPQAAAVPRPRPVPTPPPAVDADAPPQQFAATGNRLVVGTHVENANDSTVRGIVTDCVGGGVREITTTTGAVVMLKPGQLTETTLTPDEAASCVRPASRKDYVQARIDGAIRLSHGGCEFKNCYTCADGTERRQFTVTATHVRCVLCGDAHSWPLEKECSHLVGDIKLHCGQSKHPGLLSPRQHLDSLFQSAGAPPTAEASTTPASAPAAPALPPPQPQNVRPQAVAAPRKPLPRPASQRFAVGDLVEAAFHAGKTYYDGVVVAARADGGNGFLYRIEYDDGDDEDDVPEERIKHLDTATRRHGSVWVGRRLKANANAPRGRPRSEGRIVGWLPVRGVKEPFLNAAGRPAPIYRVDYGGSYREEELETYELLDESTLLPPQSSEEWQRETAFAEFLRERDVACKFSSSRPRELTARALYDKYAGAETVRAFFELGGTSEALVREICQERCTIANVDSLWSEYCAQTLDEDAEREKPDTSKAKKRARPAAPLRVGSSVQTVAGAQDRRGHSVAAARGIVTELGAGWVTVLTTEGVEMKAREAWLKPAHLSSSEKSRCVLNTNEASPPTEPSSRPSSARRVGGVVIPAKKVRGPPEPWEGLAAAPPAPKPSVKRERKPDPRTDRVAVGSHVQHSDGLRGVVTRHTYNGYEVTTKTGYVAMVYGRDLTEITLTAEEAALCNRSRLTPNEWLQAQLDGAVCAVYEGRTFGNCFATKAGRSQRTFTVESNGDVRCALCDWTVPRGESSSELQNDLSAWGNWSVCVKRHCAQTPSSLREEATKRHVERVLAMAAEPSKPPTATIDTEPRRPSKRPRGAAPVHAAAALDAEPPRPASDAVVPAKKAQGRPRKVQAPPPPPPPPTASYDWIVVGAKVQTVEVAYGEEVRGIVTEIGTAWVTVLSTEGYEVKSRRAWLAPATLTDEEASRCARGPQRPAEWLQARIDSSICVRHDQREFKNQFSTTDGRVIRQFVVDSGTTNARCALCDWKPTQDKLNLQSSSGWNTLLHALRNHCGEHQGKAAKQHMEHILSVAAAPAAVSSTPLASPPAAAPEQPAAKKPRTAPQPEAAPAPARRGRPPAKADHKSSRFAGVTWKPYKGGRWHAAIMVRGHTILLGEFDVEEDAARAYDAAQTQWQALMTRSRTLNFPGDAPLESALAALPPLPPQLESPASLPQRRRSAPPPAPAPAVSPAPAPAEPPRIPAPADVIGVGAIVEASPHAWGKGFVERCGPKARYRGTVLARDSGDRLPTGCPAPWPGEPVWRVRYDDDGEEWATPERFLSIVAPGNGQRAGRERTKPQFLSDCVDAGRTYVPTQDEDDAPGAPAPPATQLPTPPPPAAPAPVVSPAPAPAVLPAPSPLRAPSPPAAERICVGAVVAAESQVWGAGWVKKVGAAKRHRGTVIARGNGDILPEGCPPPETGERIWRVLYDDDKEDYDTPERFLSFVAPPPRAPVPAPRAAAGGRVVVGAVVEARPEAFGHEPTNIAGGSARYRGTVVEPGTAWNLPAGCPPTEAGEPIWNVLYDDDRQVWATPERFLSCAVVGVDGRKRGRCGVCEGCTADECGACKYCLDRPKRGGRNTLKQPCVHRRCKRIYDSDNSTAVAGAEAAPPPLTAPAAPPRPPTPFRLPTRSDYGDVPPTARLRKRSPPPPDEAWSPPPRAEHARPTKKPRRFAEVDQDVPAGAWREGAPRAASPSPLFAAPSSAPFVDATRWPEAGEECQFLAEGNWYSGRCDEATEARVVLLYAERHNIRGQAHVLIKDDDKPAECIRLREDAPELPANIV